MARVTPELLAHSLDRMQGDGLSAAACASAYPEAGGELAGLLELAHSITPPPPVFPSAEFRRRGRATLLAAISTEKHRATRPRERTVSRWIGNGPTSSRMRDLCAAFGSLWGRLVAGRRMLATPFPALALVVALIVAAGGGAAYAAQDALPDDMLYPIKTGVEGAQLALSLSDESKADTYLYLAARRLTEVESADRRGRGASAQVAADAFAQSMAQADRYLARAMAAGKDSDSLSEVTAHLATVESTLTAMQETTPRLTDETVVMAARAVTDRLGQPGATVSRPPVQVPAANRTPEPRATSTDEPTSQPGVPEASQTSVTRVPSSSPTATGAVRAALDDVIGTVESLAADPAVPGASYDGLLAHLRAAQAAVDRSDTGVAVHDLDAFVAELDALRRSDQIGPERYEALYASYRALVGNLGGTPRAEITSTRPAASPAQPATTPEPTREGNGGDEALDRGGQTINRPNRQRADARSADQPSDLPAPTPEVEVQFEPPTPEAGTDGRPSETRPDVVPEPRDRRTEIAPPAPSAAPLPRTQPPEVAPQPRPAPKPEGPVSPHAEPDRRR